MCRQGHLGQVYEIKRKFSREKIEKFLRIFKVITEKFFAQHYSHYPRSIA